MRKASVLPAAFLAAVFIFGLASNAEAKRAHPRRSTPTASKRSPSASPKKKVAVRGSAKTPKRARHSAHQESPRAAVVGRGTVVVDRIAVETPQFFGPFLPLETYNYPQPHCSQFDRLMEAHVHEADDETPEQANVAEAVLPEPSSPLTRVARTLGSFLHPKSTQTTVRPEDVDLSALLSAGVRIPVEGVDASRLRDSFLASRGRHRQHLAIDIGAPKGTPVIAAADGEIVRLRREQRGGISLYQKDDSGRYLLFYCHLSKYAEGLGVGRKVAKGDVIGYVGRTGHVIGGSHLHFSITRLPEDDDDFKAGVAVNPYLLFLAAVP